ncbi:hypothetical protein EDC04DRAFT_2614859 [Pisolithus marmoratus]|nr:hypothetical protein EDC04DRAFT_2614859 [Pisolithus marmoratus]
MASNNNTTGTVNTTNQGTANTTNQGTMNNTVAGTSNTMQANDMGPAIAAALNISLTEDTMAIEPGRPEGGESSNMNLDSAAPMETEGGGAQGDVTNPNNEGGEQNAPKLSSKAQGKQRATDKDGKGASESEEGEADTDTEPDVMELGRGDVANPNNEGGEKTAPKLTSKAKVKQTATGKDGEGATTGSKREL